jgi:hypothetical protein
MSGVFRDKHIMSSFMPQHSGQGHTQPEGGSDMACPHTNWYSLGKAFREREWVRQRQ